MEVQTDSLGIMNWVKKLQPMCIQVIDLIFFKGFTFKDAAQDLEIPEGTLKSRHRKCVQELRTSIGELWAHVKYLGIKQKVSPF